MNLANVAYSKEYLENLKKYEKYFDQKYLFNEENIDLSYGYSLKRKNYTVQEEFNLSLSHNELYDSKNKLLYSYKNVDSDAEFAKIIKHADGQIYLIFRTNLYGYSVLQISNLKDLHYFPAESLPHRETFIWTDVFYNIKNNILAVYGCYWACPMTVCLIKFENPLFTIDKIVDISYKFDVETVTWQGNDLVLTNLKDKKKQIIKEKDYLKYFK